MILALACFLACTPATKDTASPDSGTATATSSATGTDTDTATDAGTTTGTDTDTGTSNDATCVGEDDVAPSATGCAAEGGVCTAGGTCVSGGGTRLTAHDAECAFDDGPGECCLPPEAAATGDSCNDLGGVCAPIAGCGMVDGWFAGTAENMNDCGFPQVCCVPEDTCEGQETEICCYEENGVPMTQYVPTCDRGDRVCLPGTELVCMDDCPVP